MTTFSREGSPPVVAPWSTRNSSPNTNTNWTRQLTCLFPRKRRRNIDRVSPPSECTFSTHSLHSLSFLSHTTSLTYSLAHSLTHPLTHSLTDSLTHTLTHPLTHSLTLSLPFSHTHSLTPSSSLSPLLPLSVDYNLDQAESDPLLLELLDEHDDMEVDRDNLRSRSENRHPSLFGLYPLPSREEAKENRLPAPPPAEAQGLKLHVKVSELRSVFVVVTMYTCMYTCTLYMYMYCTWVYI